MTIKNAIFGTTSAVALVMAGFGLAVAAPAAAQQQAGTQAPETLTGRIPVGEFVKAPNMQTVRISPKGDKLAYVANKDGSKILVLLDLATMQEKPILAYGEAREAGEREVRGFRWIGNDHVVLTVISRENLGGKNPSDLRRLVAYDTKSGELVNQAWRDAGGDAGDILHIDHDTGKYLLARDSVAVSTERWGRPEVVEVDVTNGRFKRVQRTNPVVSGWSADRRGQLRFGSSYDRDNGKVRILYRGEDGGNFRTVYNEADETFTEGPPSPQWFIPGTDFAYATSRHEDTTKVYKIDLNTMKPVETVFETEGFDMNGVIVSRDGEKILGYRTFDGTNRRVWLDQDMKTVQGLLDEMFGKDDATIVDYTDNLSHIVVYGGGMTRQGGYYLYETGTGSMKLLNWSHSALKDAPMNPVKAEWYTASDGTRIQAVVTYPRHRMGQKNLPVVVMPHGGPFGVFPPRTRTSRGASRWPNRAMS